MPRTPKSTPTATEVETPVTTAALEKIKAQFLPERWAKIVRQAETSNALDEAALQSLCTRLLAIRSARHPTNDAAALTSACNGLLLAIGSRPSAADEARFQHAFKTGELSPLPVAVVVPVESPPAEPEPENQA